MNDEVYFRQGDKYQSFLQGDTTILCVYNQACPKYPNNKFTISLQYHKKNVKDEVDFLLADKCQRFLQSDTAILGVCGQPCPN